MITDARVLQPEFIPQEVKHRDGEVNYLSSVLRPILDRQPVDPAFLYGPSGVGKACIAQFTVERLRENVVELNHQYVNCWEDYSRFKTLYALLDGIGQTIGAFVGFALCIRSIGKAVMSDKEAELNKILPF